MKTDHALAGMPIAPSITRVSRRLLGLVLVVGVIVSGSGCRLCCDLEDRDYPAYGGAWERTSRSSGRVGSLFDPGGARSSQLSPRDQAGDDDGGRRRIAPGRNNAGENEGDGTPRPNDSQQKSDQETEQEFQDRLKKLQDENDMLSAEVIPGDLAPPTLR
ncbi:MAG: hypothetical protein KDB00_03035 [Planctomycetales bacterium]|nr:hypothetical protein [Planctomycetales bacterium]